MNQLFLFNSLLILLTAQILSVESLNCVVCTSCSDPWNNVTNPVSTCGFGMDTCLSSYLRYPGGSFVIKTCTTASTCLSKNWGAFGYGFFLTCCTTDSCNSASKYQSKTYITSVALILFFIFYFKNK